MEYGICDLAAVPVRIQPGEQSEMINQLLFGDVAIITDRHQNWLLIETVDDNYDGWVDEKQLLPLSEKDVENLNYSPGYFSKDLLTICNTGINNNYFILMGSRLPSFYDSTFLINGEKTDFRGSLYDASKNSNPNKVSEIAKKFLGAPYLWGGRSPFGIDCSGLTQIVYRMCGKLLPRDSSQQVLEGTTIDFVHESKPGDLAFFENKEGNIVHVGIILENQHIIHASGRVSIDKLDHQGIFNNKLQKYTHQLRVIKRHFV